MGQALPQSDGEDSEIEIRQVFEAEDFGAEFDARTAESRKSVCARRWPRSGSPTNKRHQGDAMQVQPYLFFNGRCEEAVEFYKGASARK